MKKISFQNLLGYFVNVYFNDTMIAIIDSHFGKVAKFEWVDKNHQSISEEELIQVFKERHKEAWDAEHTFMKDGYRQWVNMENIKTAAVDLNTSLAEHGLKLQIHTAE